MKKVLRFFVFALLTGLSVYGYCTQTVSANHRPEGCMLSEAREAGETDKYPHVETMTWLSGQNQDAIIVSEITGFTAQLSGTQKSNKLIRWLNHLKIRHTSFQQILFLKSVGEKELLFLAKLQDKGYYIYFLRKIII